MLYETPISPLRIMTAVSEARLAVWARADLSCQTAAPTRGCRYHHRASAGDRGFTRPAWRANCRYPCGRKRGRPRPQFGSVLLLASSWSSSALTSSNSQPPIGACARAIPAFPAPIRGDEQHRVRSRRSRLLAGPTGFGLGPEIL